MRTVEECALKGDEECLLALAVRVAKVLEQAACRLRHAWHALAGGEATARQTAC